MPDHAVISTTWALQQSATDVYKVAKGVLEAATSDNVQPLALLACESFGATLACCEQTLLKVEQAASRRGVSAVLQFMQAQVGYASNDSAAHLAKSSAGVRFMSLATALLSLGTDFEGARALSLMIEETAGADQLRPTLRQLQDLLQALQIKLVCTDFANLAIGYQIFLREHPNTPVSFRMQTGQLSGCPQVAVVKQLVNSFRLLGRIGTATDESLVGTCHCTITTRRSFAWLLAFIHWTFGAPPAVNWVSIEDEICLIPRSQSKILLRLVASADLEASRASVGHDIEIKMFESIQDLPRLWRNDANAATDVASSHWRGMVSVANWGQERITRVTADLKLTKDVLTRAIEETLAWARHWEDLAIFKDYDGIATSERAWLPSPRKLCDAFKEYTGLRPEYSFEPTDSLLKAPDASTIRTFTAGEYDRLTELVKMCTEIVAIAAFDSLKDVMLLVDNSSRINNIPRLRLGKYMCNIIGRYGECEPDEKLSADYVTECARLLIGHNVEDCQFVTSSFGRVIWPALLESLDPKAGSFTNLLIAPGSLRYKGLEYEYVEASWDRRGPGSADESSFLISGSIDRPLNLLRDRRLQWFVTAGATYLEASFGIGGSNGWRSPKDCFSLGGCLFVQWCPHSADSPMCQTDIVGTLILIEPGHSRFECNNFERRPRIDGFSIGVDDLLVFPVARNGGLRLYSLTVAPFSVVRGEACLGCCLKVCKATDRYILIL